MYMYSTGRTHDLIFCQYLLVALTDRSDDLDAFCDQCPVQSSPIHYDSMPSCTVTTLPPYMSVPLWVPSHLPEVPMILSIPASAIGRSGDLSQHALFHEQTFAPSSMGSVVSMDNAMMNHGQLHYNTCLCVYVLGVFLQK